MSQWLLESVEAFLRSPLWSAPIMTFIENNCLEFEDCEENKLEYTLIHKEYTKLVDLLIENFLRDLGVSVEEFGEACKRMVAIDQGAQRLIEQIVSATEFVLFKSMMVATNDRLKREAIQLTLQWEAQLVGSPPSLSSQSSSQPDKNAYDDEEALLAKAIALSLQEVSAQPSHVDVANRGSSDASHSDIAAKQPSHVDLHTEEDELQRALRESAIAIKEEESKLLEKEEDAVQLAIQLSLKETASSKTHDGSSASASSAQVVKLPPETTGDTCVQSAGAIPKDNAMPGSKATTVTATSAVSSSSCDGNKPGENATDSVKTTNAPTPAAQATAVSASTSQSETSVNETSLSAVSHQPPPAGLGPLKHIPSSPSSSALDEHPMSTAQPELDVDTIQERSKRLKSLRQKLVEKKKALREAGLESYTDRRIGEGSREKPSEVAKSATALASLPPLDPKRQSLTRGSRPVSASLAGMLQQTSSGTTSGRKSKK
ncbi:cilia- and flagella-associated protein 36-like isoform X1 [Sycon ciliatum]|uniref:cilia- and flagella-associated protein 36-like isoform X1 n=1 Tax=Sycon ciliatum TaxID=27933 RepID=UPI0031F72235